MKILLISNMYPSPSHPVYGIFVKNFETGIVEKGGSVYKVVIDGRGKNKIKKILNYIKFTLEVISSIFLRKYDLIYVHYAAHSLLPLVPIQAFLKRPLVVNAHGDDVFTTSKLEKFLQKIVTSIVQKATLLVVPSSYFQEAVAEKFLVPREKIFVSPSGGIDSSLFKYFDVPRKNDPFIIGFVSRIDEGKGWDTLLLAAAELKKRKKFKLVIVGGGAQKSKLLRMIAELGLHDEIDYLGPIPNHDLPTQYNRFDIFAFPSIAESLGLVGLEAMACGVPVVGSNIGGLKGYITDSYNGYLFEPGNHRELATKIETFMSLGRNDREVFRQNAINTANDYDSKLVSENLYRKLFAVLMENHKMKKSLRVDS